MNPKDNLSLDERLKDLMKKKLSKCKCNPCVCTEKKKERYFLELKSIVKRYNLENIASDLYQNNLNFTKPYIH